MNARPQPFLLPLTHLWQSLLLLHALASCVAAAQPNVVAWGGNTYGQTNVPPDLADAIAVSAGDSHSLALRADGTVVAWGRNHLGQTNVPTGLSDVVAISCGANHSLALRSDGTIVGWGSDSYGEASPPPTATNVVAVVGYGVVSYGLLADGSIISWGQSWAPSPIGLGNVTALGAYASGTGGPLALTVNGEFLRWGPAPTLRENPTNFVYAPGASGPGLTAEGKVTVLSSGYFVDSGLSNIVALAATYPNYLALRDDGTLFSTAPLPYAISNAVGVACGSSHFLAVVGQGPPRWNSRPMDLSINFGRTARLYAPATGAWPLSYQWQLNGADIPGATRPMLALPNVQRDQLGSYSLVVSNSAGVAVNPVARLSLLPIVGPPWSANVKSAVAVAGVPGGVNLALRHDGALMAWGPNDRGQANVPPGLSNVIAISTGKSASASVSETTDHSLALTASGSICSWGRNTFTNFSPVLSNIAQISGGYMRDVALSADGKWASWSGATISPPDTYPRSNLVQVVAAGSGGWVYLLADGTVAQNFQYPIVPLLNGVSNVVSVTAGYDHVAALRADGSVLCWGANDRGQIDVPPALTNVIALAAGSPAFSQYYKYTLALKDDGTIVAWGSFPDWVSNMVDLTTDGVALDSGVALVGNGPPFLATPLVNRSGPVGGHVFFRALATGERPLSYQWRLNGEELPGQTRNVLQLTNLSPQDAGAYSLLLSNAWGCVTSSPSILTVYDYAPVLNTSNLTWTSFGDMPWFPQTNFTHDGVSAAQSGYVSGSTSLEARSTLRATVTGPGTLTFWWKVSCRSGFQFLSFYLNEAQPSLFYITGETDWEQRTVYLGPGLQTLDWAYRSQSPGAGLNAGWLDQVIFTPGATPVLIKTQPSGCSQALGGDVTFSVAVTGTPPFHYQWRRDEVDLPDATGAVLTITNVQPADASTYSVEVSNIAGSVISSNATLVLGRIAQWGQVPLPPSVTNAVALAAGLYHGLALQSDGTVLAWGNNSSGQSTVPPGLANTRSVGAGAWFSLAIDAEHGALTAWGDNTYGQSTVPAGLTNALMAAGGFYHAAVLKNDGTVVCWGSNQYAQTNVPPDLTNAVQIAAAGNHNAALKSDGTVVAWGANTYGETNVPPGLNDVVGVRAGFNHCLALRSDGSVVVWGITNASFGLTNIPVGLTNVVGIAAGGEYNLALTPDGKVTSWGLDRGGDTIVPGGLGIVASVVAGGYFSLALISEEAPCTLAEVRNPSVSNGQFQLMVRTEAGRVYRLEHKDSLGDPLWTRLPLVAGDGREQTLLDPRPLSAQRFYRVRAW